MSQSMRILLDEVSPRVGVNLTGAQLDKLTLFSEELLKWNRKINLTAITDEREMAVKHFADSLALVKVIGSEGSLLDVGSGGGFPAIPLKIAIPALSVVSVDAVEKKIMFQRHVARVMELEDFTAIHARCETLQEKFSGRFNWVVSRAFSDLNLFARLAAPFLKDNGVIVAMKGKRGEEEAQASGPALAEVAISVEDIVEFTLPLTGDRRTLVLLKKSSRLG